jgi:ATP-dependent RNA helicase SUPV3L1/SUV3
VAEEVKGLDQPARATLRKYGVRFGAYHIYLPTLLKPAPRSLATQLWAIKHEAPDAKGISDLLHLAASGRTSIPTDKETPKLLYRTAGYRVADERAVRVDILERLADLIRPALSWRETSPGPKPDGVFDGRGFTVTGAMTSLTGASSEDFASILRSLGYRMDRKPKPAEPAAPVAVPPSEAARSSDVPAEAATEAAPLSEPAIDAAAAGIAPTAEVVAVAPLTDPVAESLPVETTATESAPAEIVGAAAPEILPENKSEEAASSTEHLAGRNLEEVDLEASAAASAEPAMIEVWRPAGRFEKRPHRPRRPQRTPKAAAQAAAAPAENADTVVAAPIDAVPAETTEKPSFSRPDRDRKDQDQRQQRHERQQRMERQGQRFERKDNAQRRDRPPRRDKGDRVERAEREQYYAKPHGSGSDRRDKQPDPNSPFAKLAALKQQLEQSTKES